jgi:hypothetical protein
MMNGRLCAVQMQAGYVVLSAQPLFNCLARWYDHRLILSSS